MRQSGKAVGVKGGQFGFRIGIMFVHCFLESRIGLVLIRRKTIEATSIGLGEQKLCVAVASESTLHKSFRCESRCGCLSLSEWGEKYGHVTDQYGKCLLHNEKTDVYL